MRTMYLTYDLAHPFFFTVSVTDTVETETEERTIKLSVPEDRVDFVQNPQNFCDRFSWFDYVTEHFSA